MRIKKRPFARSLRPVAFRHRPSTSRPLSGLQPSPNVPVHFSSPTSDADHWQRAMNLAQLCSMSLATQLTRYT